MPRPRSLSHAIIAEAALAVIDREGLEALSMRAVAAELGVGAMSLYRYVSGREEVERLVVDLIFRSIDPRVPPRASWQRQIRELSERVRTAVATHASVIPLLLVHFQYSPSAWSWLESLLGALIQAGFTARQRVIVVRCLQAYVVGALQSEFHGPLTGAGTAMLASMSPESHPLIVETARSALTVTPEQEFGQGLEILLRGLKASLPQGEN